MCRQLITQEEMDMAVDKIKELKASIRFAKKNGNLVYAERLEMLLAQERIVRRTDSLRIANSAIEKMKGLVCSKTSHG